MKASIFFPFIILIVYGSVVSGQVLQDWVARYDGSGDGDYFASSLTIDGQGNVYVTGYSNLNGLAYDYTTIKYNSAGIQQWVAGYDDPYHLDDYANSIAVDGQGNVYVTGMTSVNGTNKDFATIKYNSSGVQQWVQIYSGPGNDRDEPGSIVVDASGNIYVTGYCTVKSGTTGQEDYATVKYNSSGVQQWVQLYNGPGSLDDLAASIAVDNDGNVYVTGSSRGMGTGSDYASIKYNLSGIQQWVARYNGPVNYADFANSIAVDLQGNVYVTGSSHANQLTMDYATIKYNSSGVQQWVQRYNGPGDGNDEAYSIAVDGNGSVYVTGLIYSYGNMTGLDYATIKYNASGVQQWVSIYDGPGNKNDIGHSVTLDGQGNVYVTGFSYGGEMTQYDYATVKYDSSGVQKWVARYNGPGNYLDNAYAIAVDGEGNVYVTGYSNENDSCSGFATVKYSQPVGIKKISNEIPSQFGLSQNYPNPFNPATTIKFDITKSTSAKLVIYDILGREVEVLVNEDVQPGTYEVKWNAGGFASGFYFYKLVTSDFTSTMKMVLSK